MKDKRIRYRMGTTARIQRYDGSRVGSHEAGGAVVVCPKCGVNGVRRCLDFGTKLAWQCVHEEAHFVGFDHRCSMIEVKETCFLGVEDKT